MTSETYPSRKAPARKAIPEWLDQLTFTRFVTLATNWGGTFGTGLSDPSLRKLRDRLREWDGRINHAILGKHWADRDHDRTFAFYFLEKPQINPHWHGLIRFFPIEGYPIREQQQIFDEHAGPIWKTLVPPGTTDVKPITLQRGVAEYVRKMLGHELSYQNYVVADEFRRLRLRNRHVVGREAAGTNSRESSDLRTVADGNWRQ